MRLSVELLGVAQKYGLDALEAFEYAEAHVAFRNFVFNYIRMGVDMDAEVLDFLRRFLGAPFSLLPSVFCCFS